MSQLPVSFGGGAFDPTPRQPAHNDMQAANTAVPSTVPQAQQAAFLQNSQLPGIDMAGVLSGITPEQIAFIGQLYQLGHITLPSAQNFPATQPQPLVTNAQPATQENVAVHSAEGQETYSGATAQGMANGANAKHEQRDFIRPPPTAPRKRSGSVHMRPESDGADKRTKRQQSPPRQPQGYDRRRPEPRTGGQTLSFTRSQLRQHQAKQDATNDFIRTMYRAGYGFDDMNREINDERMLRLAFKELGLNAPLDRPQSTQTESTPAFAQPHGQNTSFIPTATPTQGSPLSVPAPKPAPKAASKPPVPEKASAPVSADRSAYLAKLQAAKNKKNESLIATPKPSSLSTSAPAQTGAQTREFQQLAVQQPVRPIVQPSTTPQPKKATVQTELIKKKLEALKAEQARRLEAERLANAAAISTPNPVPAAPSISQSAVVTPAESTSGDSHVATPAPVEHPQVVPATRSAATSFETTSQFPGLPGLFMTGTPTQPSAQNTEPDAPAASANLTNTGSSSECGLVTSSEASPVAAPDLPVSETSLPPKVTATSSGRATPKHPFNQNRYDSNEDSVIINVSDEEDSESELDDMEEDADDDEVARMPTANTVVPVAKPGPLKNIPAPAISANANTPGTPSATTPGGSAYERKMQEISEMHRRIAEMQKAKLKAKPSLPVAPQETSVAPSPTNAPTNTLTTLPGLTETVDNPSVDTTVNPQSAEQRLVDSSRQMESKLAQLEEEAEMISEQTNPTSQGTPPTSHTLEQTEGAIDPKADSTALSDGGSEDDDDDDDDDDDAMDLSSGEDSDPDDNADVVDAVIPATSGDEGSPGETIPTGICANDLAMMSDSSSDSDDSSTDSEDDSENDSDDEYEPALAEPAPAELVAETVSSTTTLQASPQDVDLAPELQPLASEQTLSNAAPKATRKPHYTPYESPLRNFKDYVFHPRFGSDIQGGFNSLTYSNNLDPTEPMCPTELETGMCQDSTCSYQHLRNAAINNADILKDLGTRNPPWKTAEEKVRYENGLAEVIRELRNTGQGTDFNAIATGIAKYRREFIGIPDQTLTLVPASKAQ